MKNLLCLLVCTLIGITAQARTITEQEALQKAQAFMQGKVLCQGAASRVMRRAPQAGAMSNAYFVFNVEDNGGFVIIAADDSVDPIIGYSTQGSFDDDTMPENMRAWLELMSEEIKAIASAPATVRASSAPQPSQKAVTIHRAIGPLIITTWNQGNTDNVYNSHLPLIEGQRPCTGCVATAGAQVMYYYHRYLPTTTQVVPGYVLLDDDGNDCSNGADTHEDLPAIQFQWDKMKTQYSYKEPDAPNSEEEDAVADLMLYCAYAAKMNFGLDASGASTWTLAEGMSQYLGFDADSWTSVSRSAYSISEWDELMYNELANGRPILYSGASDKWGRGGHAFICDGYDDNGLYHFNWGWGGNYNGYFKLGATNPYGENRPGETGYIFDNHCIIGLQPASWPAIEDPNADDTWEVPQIEGVVATASHVRIDGTTVTMRMTNWNEATYGFGFGIGELNGDGTLTPIDTSKEYYKNTELGQGWYFSSVSFNFGSYDLPEGTHRIVPISLVNGESEWLRCKPADLYFDVNVTGSEKAITVHPIDHLQIDNFALATGGTPNCTQAVTFTVTNLGDNIEKSLYLYVGTADDNGKYASGKYIKIKAGNTKSCRMTTSKLDAGSHTLRLLDDGNNVLAQTNVVIKQELKATAFDFSEPRFASSTIKVNATVENLAGDYAAPLYLFAQNGNTKTLQYVAGATIESGSQEEVTFYFVPKTAALWTLYVATDNNGKEVIGTTTVEVAAPPTGTVTLKLTDCNITCVGNSATLTMTIKNTGTTTNYREIYSWLDQGENYIGFKASPKTIIEPGETKQVTITYDNLENGKDYHITLNYSTQYSSWSGAWLGANDFTFDSKPMGDANGDGAVTPSDAIMTLYHFFGVEQTGFIAEAADMNGDGSITPSDAIEILYVYFGSSSASRSSTRTPEPQ